MQIRPVAASDYEALARMASAAFPDFQRRGIGSALIDLVLTTIRQQYAAISVRTFTREDIPHALRCMEKRGFTVAKRTWKSALDVPAFDSQNTYFL